MRISITAKHVGQQRKRRWNIVRHIHNQELELWHSGMELRGSKSLEHGELGPQDRAVLLRKE
jgi:hypothetical protein